MLLLAAARSPIEAAPGVPLESAGESFARAAVGQRAKKRARAVAGRCLARAREYRTRRCTENPAKPARRNPLKSQRRQWPFQPVQQSNDSGICAWHLIALAVAAIAARLRQNPNGAVRQDLNIAHLALERIRAPPAHLH